MTGLWLVSYIVLWLLVIILGLITIGLLQQLSLLYSQLEQRGVQPTTDKELPHPLPANDGPDIGSAILQLAVNSINGFSDMNLSSYSGYSLLMFLSPLCETCQHIVESLNNIATDSRYKGRIIAIMRADKRACQAFIDIFPLRSPVICDENRSITMNFQVHHAPFGLLYDEYGKLIRKGGIKNPKDLALLLEGILQP